jgi:hypothetical protein
MPTPTLRVEYTRRTASPAAVAGTLTAELTAQDYDVFRYGMECTIPGLLQLLKSIRKDVVHIKRLPDFVLWHQGGKEIHLIELEHKFPAETLLTVVISGKRIKWVPVGTAKDLIHYANELFRKTGPEHAC